MQQGKPTKTSIKEEGAAAATDAKNETANGKKENPDDEKENDENKNNAIKTNWDDGSDDWWAESMREETEKRTKIIKSMSSSSSRNLTANERDMQYFVSGFHDCSFLERLSAVYKV